jgi:hypothetical protein
MKMNMSPARIGYRPARQNAHPAIAANTRLAIDTWFGVMRAEASDRAMACGHPALRVRSSRRAGGGDTSSDVGGMRDSVIRMLGGSLGFLQDFSGPMAKQHRMFVLTMGALIAAMEIAIRGRVTALWIALVIIVAGAALTAALRIARIARQLEARP